MAGIRTRFSVVSDQAAEEEVSSHQSLLISRAAERRRGVLPGIGEDEVTNHSLITSVSFTRFALEKLDGFAVESQSYLLFLVHFAHELIERRKLALSQGAQISNDLALIVCVSNRFFLHRLKRWNRS
jgi:hypothetical protein